MRLSLRYAERRRRPAQRWFVMLLGLAAIHCGSGTVTNPGGGGSAGSAPNGGASGAGGAPGAGGASSGGGNAGSSGGSVTGGGSGSATTGTGGGGASSGGGGAASTGGGGGTSNTGGAAGTAVDASTGRNAGTDGGGRTDGATSAGCNAATWPMGGTANPQTLSVTVNGAAMDRQFYFALPTTYTSSRVYRVVFAWHYAGGTALMIASNGGGGRYYGLQPLMPDTIFVTGQGLNDAQGRTGWPNTNGQDVAFASAMVDWVNANFCVDQSRIMSTGFSYGAIMSHTLACAMPDVFRAVGVMSGSLIGRATSCVNHPIAAWMTHGSDDTFAAGGVDFSAGETARDRLVALNHCAATTQPVDPAPCVAYDGCDSGYPVIWCPREAPRTDTGHVIPTFAAAAITTFFSQF